MFDLELDHERFIVFNDLMFLCRLSQSSSTPIHRVTVPSNHPPSFSIKTTGKVKASVISREDDLLSYTNGNAPIQDPLQADSVSLGTLASSDSANAPPNGFVAEDDDYELDLPTPGFSSIPEAIQDIRQGKVRFFFFLSLLA